MPANVTKTLIGKQADFTGKVFRIALTSGIVVRYPRILQ